MNPSRLSIAVVTLLGVINIGRGGIHMFAPDGGLEMIAGLDISAARPIILSFIASIGAGQIAVGLIDFAAVARFRNFVRPLLLVHLTLQALAVFLLFVWRPLPHGVPGQWGALAGLVVIGFFAALEYSRETHVAEKAN